MLVSLSFAAVSKGSMFSHLKGASVRTMPLFLGGASRVLVHELIMTWRTLHKDYPTRDNVSTE